MVVYESRRFEKALAKLPEATLEIVENEIERIIAAPLIGQQKKGDLAHLRVHKFNVNNAEMLLAYSLAGGNLTLYLLHLASHENFYDEMKRNRKADLRLID